MLTDAQVSRIESSFASLPTDALDREVLLDLESAQIEGDPDLVIELIDLYLQDAPRLFETICTSVVNADLASLKPAAHTLKGSSGSLGVHRVAGVCRKIEVAALIGQTRELKRLVVDLEGEYQRAVAALETEKGRRAS